ncbi:MAG TPA: phosphatase PAP2 family protein [Dokdonella sp.]|uniref:phosphatase PAP2 family protein n=1 Tax=Dokdonella sp. TaxID=2291710 RepID=UPI002D7E1E40|nr:phosphatase PAP2 family protein [Dokdonella sp.]HET9033173.1 phosphatase PAP2 family protein [Dokdonella sp.]
MRWTEPRRPTLTRYLFVHVLLISALLVTGALFLRDSGWDLRVEDAFYTPALHGFGMRHSVWLELIGHQLLLILPIGLGLLALIAAIAASRFEPLRTWRGVLWAMLASVCIGPLLIGVLKQFTAAHCPWDLVRYGSYADYVQHWFAHARADAGHCLPNAHAGAGFTLIALYFAGWASGRATWRWWGLAAAIAAGIVFSLVRMVQGAHFPSHSLWAAAVDWLVTSLFFLPLIVRRRADHNSGAAQGVAESVNRHDFQ